MNTLEIENYKTAYYLSWFTIGYNLLEGLVSVGFGIQDETLALFGFGVDSFIECISGIGILLLVRRVLRNPLSERSTGEVRALKITGWCFYGFVGGLVLGAIWTIYENRQPESTWAGLLVSILSIAVMTWLAQRKIRLGQVLHSQAIVEDGKCTRTCVYMSVILLVSSLLYEAFRIPYVDVVGTLGLAYYAFREGKESLEKAENESCSCC